MLEYRRFKTQLDFLLLFWKVNVRFYLFFYLILSFFFFLTFTLFYLEATDPSFFNIYIFKDLFNIYFPKHWFKGLDSITCPAVIGNLFYPRGMLKTLMNRSVVISTLGSNMEVLPLSTWYGLFKYFGDISSMNCQNILKLSEVHTSKPNIVNFVFDNAW